MYPFLLTLETDNQKQGLGLNAGYVPCLDFCLHITRFSQLARGSFRCFTQTETDQDRLRTCYFHHNLFFPALALLAVSSALCTSKLNFFSGLPCETPLRKTVLP